MRMEREEKTFSPGERLGLRDVWEMLFRYRKQILAATVLSALLLGFHAAFLTPVLYRSGFTAFVVNSGTPAELSRLSDADLAASRELAAAYAQVIQGQRVLSAAAAELEGEYTYIDLEDAVIAEADAAAPMLHVTVTMRSGTLAYQTARALETVTPRLAEELVPGSSMTVVSEAGYARRVPVGYGKRIAAGALLGFILPVLALSALTLLDRRVKDRETLERRTGVPVLGTVPTIAREEEKEPPARETPPTEAGSETELAPPEEPEPPAEESSPEGEPAEEAEREAAAAETPNHGGALLAENLFQRLEEGPGMCIAVTGAEDGADGVPTALTLAREGRERGKRTLLADLDLRDPTLSGEL